MSVQKIYRSLIWLQSLYYAVTAIWPLLHIESFVAVTGPKWDVWLVKTVSVLLIPIVICLMGGLFIREAAPIVILVGGSSAAGLAAIEFYYTAQDRIRWVYGADGVLQTALLLVWIWLLFHRQKLQQKPAG